jgi:hypothetical protein
MEEMKNWLTATLTILFLVLTVIRCAQIYQTVKLTHQIEQKLKK